MFCFGIWGCPYRAKYWPVVHLPYEFPIGWALLWQEGLISVASVPKISGSKDKCPVWQTRRQFGSDKRQPATFRLELESLFPSGQSIHFCIFCCVESIGVFPHLCTSRDLQAPRGIGVLVADREVWSDSLYCGVDAQRGREHSHPAAKPNEANSNVNCIQPFQLAPMLYRQTTRVRPGNDAGSWSVGDKWYPASKCDCTCFCKIDSRRCGFIADKSSQLSHRGVMW